MARPVMFDVEMDFDQGMPSHPKNCQCQPCWNVRLKRNGLGVVKPGNQRNKSVRRRAKKRRGK